MKTWIAGFVLCAFIMEFPLSLSEAQTGNTSIFPKTITSVLKGESKEETAAQAEFVTLTCPVDGRQFQVGVTPEDIEFRNGTRGVVCPYDGTVFFPSLTQTGVPKKEKLTLVAVRCPVDGREFKAEMNVEDFLAGRSGASLRCPYDGTKFRLSVLGTPETEPETIDRMTTLKSPTDTKSFRAFLEKGTKEELFSPFDRSRLPSQKLTQVQTLSPIGQMGVEPMERIKPELSRIEEMFVKGISQGVSKGIRQFGYDIFPQYIEGFTPTATPSPTGTQSTEVASNFLRQFGEVFGLGDSASVFGSKGILGTQQPMGSVGSTYSGAAVGPDYVVGPGDTLVVNIWGSAQQSLLVTVDADGKIILPKAGPVYVWGLTLSEAEALIQKSLKEHYTNFNISVSMGKLRTIRVFVFGEINVPGTYYVSPQATLLHALYAAWGPKKIGSLRHIRLLRADKTEEVVDLYEILIHGNNKQDLPLKANDTILVPPIGNVIGLAGNVKRPAIYETVPPVSLTQMLEMAGGPSASGYLQRIQIERIKDHERKVVQDFEFTVFEDLQKKGSSILLQDGDLVSVFPITSQRYNFVSILGSVERPGDYELKDGMRLRDLLEKAGGVLPGSYLKRAELARYQTDKSREILSIDLWKLLSGDESLNLPLKEWDVVTVYSRSEVIPPKFVEINGAVREPGTYELTEGMRMSDLIFRAGGMSHSATPEVAELFRASGDEPPRIIPLNLEEILRSETTKDFYLLEGDRLFIRESPAEIEGGTIVLGGEFRYPGKYAIQRGETLSSVIRRAGGFTDQAFLRGAVFTRKSLRDQQRERMKQFLQAEQNALLQEQASLGLGYDPTQKASRMGLLEYREKFLKEIDKSEFLGRMIVRLADPETLSGTSDDIVLEDGDSLALPRPPSSVLVVGNVYNPIAVTFVDGKNVDYYLRKVGGMTKSADKKRVYVVKANGEAASQFVRVKPIERGDTVIVPEEFRYRTPVGLLVKDTVNLLYQIAFGAIAIAAVND